MAQTQDVQVALTPVMNGNGSFNSWQMSVNKGAPQGPGSYKPIAVTQGNKADFTFTIQNGSQQNITFAAVLVPAENKDIHKVLGQGTATLTFKDHNWSAGPVPYEILFNGAPKLDPIIDNGGGGPPFWSNYVLEGAGVFALLVILFFIVRPMFKKR